MCVSDFWQPAEQQIWKETSFFVQRSNYDGHQEEPTQETNS